MSNDDDLSKTMVIPNPGGRRSGNAGRGQTPPAASSSQQSPFDQTPFQQTASQPVQGQQPSASFNSSETMPIAGENTLLVCAAELINLASNMMTLTPNNSVDMLRQDVNGHIEKLDKRLLAKGTPPEIALTARYLICCLIDELVLSTPWGVQSNWSRQTLLSKYHNETGGGEKFFLIINKLMEQAQRNIDLIELSYLCLNIGFRGKYRVLQNGENEITHIETMLQQAISLYRPCANELSPSWRVNIDESVSIEQRMPPTLLFIVLVFLCVSVYIALLSNLHAQSSPLFAKIESVGWHEQVSHSVALQEGGSETRSGRHTNVSYPNVVKDIEQSLSSAMSEGLVQVVQQEDMLIIRLISPQLFPSGSTQVNAQFLPDRTRLLNIIKSFTDSIVIVGHTDASGKPESNWVISRRRAESIERWIQTGSGPRLQTTTRGVAATQAIAEGINDSRNRRVEILVFLTAEVPQ